MSIKKLRNQVFDNFGLNGYMDMNPSQAYANEPSILDLPSTRMPEIEIPDVAPGNEDLKNMRYWQSQQEEPEETPYEALVRRSAEYRPETEASERYRRLLDEAPERSEPNFMSKLAGAGAYLGNMQRHIPGGQEAAEKAKYAGYNREMADWTARTEPFAKAADIERQNNTQDRTLASNVIASEAATKRTEAQERVANEKNRIQEEKNIAAAESAKIRALAYDYKSRGWEVETRGSRVIATRPPGPGSPNGEYKDLGDSKMMDQRDLENLKGQWGVKRAEALGESRESIVERQQHPDLTIGGKLHTWDTDLQTYVEKMPGPEGAAVNRIGPPGTGTRTATQNREERNSLFRALADEDPSLVTEGILVRPDSVNGDWQMVEPPKTWGGWGNPDSAKVKKYNAARQKLGLPPMGGTATEEKKPDTGKQAIGGNNAPPAPTKPVAPTKPLPNVYTPQRKPNEFGPTARDAAPREPYFPPAVTDAVKKATAPGTGRGTYNPGGYGMNESPSSSGAPPPSPIQTKAEEWLRKNGQAVTPANIEAVIKRGVVR